MIFSTIYRFRFFALAAMITVIFGCIGNDNIRKGNACLSLGDYEMAEMFFEKTLNADPLSFEGRLGMGKALLQHVTDNKYDTVLWKKALLNLESAMNLQPQAEISYLVSDAWFERSQIFLANNDTLGAFNALSRSIEINNKNTSAINSIGILYFRQNDADKAVYLFKQAITIDSTHSSALFNLGMALWSNNEYENARKYWLAASRFSPDDNDIIYWLAMAEKKLEESAR